MSFRLKHADGLFRPEGDDAPSIGWLGQAGFVIETDAHRLLIDPYLSDSLAKKYAGRKHPHIRMAAAPVTPSDMPRPDLVLVTHAHTDHLDGETLGPLAARFPDLPFVVPRSCLEVARSRIGTNARLVGVSAGDRLSPLSGLAITVTPAAHEARQRDADGNDLFLGYGIDAAGLRLSHPGDTVVFPDLHQALTDFAPDIALFPVNGRDAQRLADGIPGNMTLEEATELARDIGADILVPHHWGLFDFNTIEPAAIDRAAAASDAPVIVKPALGARLRVEG